MIKKDYRNKIDVYYSILSLLSQNRNMRISKICTLTNLSHYAFLNRAKEMVEAGIITDELIELEGIGRTTILQTRTWNITDKGKIILDTLTKMNEMLESIGGAFTN